MHPIAICEWMNNSTTSTSENYAKVLKWPETALRIYTYLLYIKYMCDAPKKTFAISNSRKSENIMHIINESLMFSSSNKMHGEKSHFEIQDWLNVFYLQYYLYFITISLTEKTWNQLVSCQSSELHSQCSRKLLLLLVRFLYGINKNNNNKNGSAPS